MLVCPFLIQFSLTRQISNSNCYKIRVFIEVKLGFVLVGDTGTLPKVTFDCLTPGLFCFPVGLIWFDFSGDDWLYSLLSWLVSSCNFLSKFAMICVTVWTSAGTGVSASDKTFQSTSDIPSGTYQTTEAKSNLWAYGPLQVKEGLWSYVKCI